MEKEDLTPIAMVDYETVSKIKELVNLILGLTGSEKKFDDYFEISLVHNSQTSYYYEDEDDYDDDEDWDEDDEDWDDDCGSSRKSSYDGGSFDSDPPKPNWYTLDDKEKVDWCIDFAYENQDDTPIFPHVNISSKTDDVPEKLVEYLRQIGNTGINELCLGSEEFVDTDSIARDESPCWY